jgi:hypothetical protein
MNDQAIGRWREDRIGEPESSIAGAAQPAGGPSPFLAPNIPDTSGPGPTALQEPAAWTYDFNPATGSSRATYNGEVTANAISTPAAGVDSFNGRTGVVVLDLADVTAAGGAPIDSPIFTGNPAAPTRLAGDSSGGLATTMFVQQAIANEPTVSSFNGRMGAVTLTTGDITGAGGAPTVSPALTGVPTAPTASQGDVSSQIATDAFVSNAIAAGTVITFNGRRGAVSLTLSDVQSVGGAPIASPVFTGTPAVPTAAPGSATTQAASTAFVTNAITAGTAGVSSVNTRTGAVVLNASDLAAMGGAPLASPAFVANPTAPTPSAGDNSTRLATTAYVETAIGSLPAGVSTFNGRTGTVTLALADVTSVGGAPLASPTFTGSPLSTTPTPLDNSTRIATTAFVDAALPAPSTTTPLMNGPAAVGTGTTWARADHVHPVDTSRYAASNPSGFQTAAQVTASLANYLPLSGGILSGNLTLSGAAPTISNTASGGFIILYGGSGLYADTNNYGVGESGSFAVATNWRYIFSRSTGTRVWTDFNQITLMSLPGSGNLSISGTLSQASDARTKRDIVVADEGLEEVRRMQPRRYRRVHPEPPADQPGWKPEDREELGFVAQEMAEALPHAVRQHDDHTQAIELMPLIAALTNAVKELDARLAGLEDRFSPART